MHRFLMVCVLSAVLCSGGAAWAKDGKGHGPKPKATRGYVAKDNEKRQDKIEKRDDKRDDKVEKREAKAIRKAPKPVVRSPKHTARPRPVATAGHRRPPMRFRGLDRNHDGRITRDEWRGNDVSFRVHDWNGDGVLSGEEVRPGAHRPPKR